ncbi:HepT-like ribonuclease domain-containing protein [Magnetospirillum sp. 15-1]|uniref:HepT-like ribonuclease domain-containing protein n=1 Tax=Magnetospirillum sp. 15-1 TaxID=1979370 RepID=UPI000BBB6E7F|nr:HepT-like ribonuclease domain-containing protein [Magnetospirillum sp. 15-1]
MSFAERRRATEALDAILSAIDEIGEFVGGRDRESFLMDRKTSLAVTHLVMMIGEASRDLLDGIAERRPEIPWKQVRDMRHRIAHEYLAVDFRLVWDVATNDLASLRAALLKERDFLTSC